jgi:hypothetical protein
VLPKKRRRSEVSASKKNGSLMPSAGTISNCKSTRSQWRRILAQQQAASWPPPIFSKREMDAQMHKRTTFWSAIWLIISLPQGQAKEFQTFVVAQAQDEVPFSQVEAVVKECEATSICACPRHKVSTLICYEELVPKNSGEHSVCGSNVKKTGAGASEYTYRRCLDSCNKDINTINKYNQLVNKDKCRK